MKRFFNNRFKKALNFGIGIAIFLLLAVAFLLVVSPKKTAPFKDANGIRIKNSIAEIIDLEINGVEQRLVIRGKNLSNPILLHLHGGPGSPDRPFFNKDETLEDLFTVCYWEQRGAGASYHKTIPKKSMTLTQIVKDGKVVSEYLKERFHKNKIYLQGHSWGTAVGSHMAKKYPELFYAYIGISQMANTKLSEQLSYDFALSCATSLREKGDLEELEKINRPPYDNDKEWRWKTMVERKIMRPYQDDLIDKKQTTLDIYKAFLFHKEYSIKDKLAALKGDPFSMDHLWPTAIQLNLFESIKAYKIPVYFIQGKHDKTTVTAVTKLYFDAIEAPTKKYYEFEKSAHSPHIEEFKKYKTIISGILKKRNK